MKILKSDLKQVQMCQERGGWLLRVEFGGTADRSVKHDTYLRCVDDAASAEYHEGATILFMDDDDAQNAFACGDEFADMCAALSKDGHLVSFEFWDEDEYVIVDDEVDND